MATPAIEVDALRVHYAGVQVETFERIGTLDGVVVLDACARNGVGVGRIRAAGAAGDQLSYKAPGSLAWGEPVTVSLVSDEEHVLRDGTDDLRFVRVGTYSDWLGSAGEATLDLVDTYNVIGGGDVNAGQAAGGDTGTQEVELENVAPVISITTVKVWLDVLQEGIEISDDGVAWVAPTEEGTALSFLTIRALDSKTLYIRRTITAGTDASPYEVVLLRYGYDYDGERYHGDIRGAFRVANDAEFRFHRSNTVPPVETDTPWDTDSSLSHSPTDTFADGTWYLAVSEFDGIIDSGFRPIGPNGENYRRLEVSGGAQLPERPIGPQAVAVTLGAGGTARVRANYWDQDASRLADDWSLAYTTDGSDPPEDTPDVVIAMGGNGGAEVLDRAITAQPHGTTIKVRVQTRKGSGPYAYSADSAVYEVTADATGPAAVIGAQATTR